MSVFQKRKRMGIKGNGRNTILEALDWPLETIADAENDDTKERAHPLPEDGRRCLSGYGQSSGRQIWCMRSVRNME